MESNYVRQLIGNKRYKLAPNTNTNLQLQLEEKTKPLTEYDIIDIVNLQNLFEEERRKATNYRFNGKLAIYTSNVLSTGATNTVWDPMFYGTPPVAPNNWVMQITYPSDMDFNYLIQARTPSGTISSNAFRGLQYEMLGDTLINGDDKLTVSGIQTHNLVVGEYIYLYSNTSYNPLQGIHKIQALGINDEERTKSLTLDTIINTVPSGSGNFVKIVEPSFDDINFNNPSLFSTATATDISGSTSGSFSFGETRYATINSTTPHNLLVNDFVDIRTGTSSVFNGTWRVYSIVSTTKFVIRIDLSIPKGTTQTYSPYISWRRLDGTPSEYYIRNFEVLTSNNYEVYPCAFSTNTYSDVSDPTIGTVNDIWSFQYNQDVSVERIRDNRGGPISEMYYTIVKRAGQNPFDWTNVIADWDFNHETTSVSPYNGLEIISQYVPSSIGTIEKFSARTETIDINGEIKAISGSKYIGDFIDYNSKEIQERTIAEIIHRFGTTSNLAGEGYYHKPFKKLQLRKYSNIIETAPSGQTVVDIPENYVTYADSSIAWKDLLTIGYFEEGTNGVDYPFVNGAHYFYFNHNLYIRRQRPPVLIDQSGARVAVNLNEEC
jgi:hypothetical protein